MGSESEGGSGRSLLGRKAGPQGPPLRRQLAVAAVIVGLVAAALALFGVYGAVRDIPFRVFTKEVLESTHLPLYTGFFASSTWFLWVVAGTAGLLAAAVLRKRDTGDRRIGFFLAASALTGLLLLDDFVMLHDRLFPRLGIPEEALYVLYAVLLVVLLVRFRAQFVEGGALLVIAAAAFWAVSLAADFVQEHVGFHAHVLEDGAKMAGTALWAAFMAWSSYRAISDPRPAPLADVPQPVGDVGGNEGSVG